MSNDDGRTSSAPPVSQSADPAPADTPRTSRRMALVMALSDPTRQISLISWLGKGS